MNKQSNLFQEVSNEEIGKIFDYYLGEAEIREIKLLEGGLFNTTYFVRYGSTEKRAVLRLGPINRHLLMGFEQNLMIAEQFVYEKCKEQAIPCSNVLACDTSKKIVDRDLIIVEYIPSIVMSKVELSQEERDNLYKQMGEYLFRLHQVKGNSFGFVSRVESGKSFECWSDALYYEVEDIVKRLEQTHGFTKEEANDVLKLYVTYKEILDEIKEPCLLHTDLWEGNVLLDEKSHEIVAIIDGDRAVFGDPEFEFASSWMNNDNLRKGYGKEKEADSKEKNIRKKLYEIFYLLIECYVGFAEYNNLEMYENSKEKIFDEIKLIEIDL